MSICLILRATQTQHAKKEMGLEHLHSLAFLSVCVIYILPGKEGRGALFLESTCTWSLAFCYSLQTILECGWLAHSTEGCVYPGLCRETCWDLKWGHCPKQNLSYNSNTSLSSGLPSRILQQVWNQVFWQIEDKIYFAPYDKAQALLVWVLKQIK